MKVTLAACACSFLVQGAFGFDEGADKAKRHNRQLSKIIRKKRHQDHDKPVEQKSLRVAQMSNSNFPNIKEMMYGVNVLLGKPPNEIHGVTQRILDFDYRGNIDDVTYLDYARARNGCKGHSSEKSIHYSLSTETMKEQSTSSSTGFDQKIEWSVTAAYEGIEATAATTTQNTLAFGNSEASGSLKQSARQSSSYSFSSYGEKSIFDATLHWSRVTEYDGWDDYFKNECVNLGENPSDTAVISFFKRFGTHGLKHASFGKRCTALVSMQGETTHEVMQDWSTSTKSSTIGYGWFKSSKESTSSESSGTVEENNFSWKTTNMNCVGEIKDTSNCNNISPSDNYDSPVVIDWEYFPIWKMSVPGLTSGAKNNMERIVENAVKESRHCGDTRCNRRGSCPLSGNMSSNLDMLIDHNTCVCDSGYSGKNCEQRECDFKLKAKNTHGGSWFGGWFQDLYEGYEACHQSCANHPRCNGFTTNTNIDFHDHSCHLIGGSYTYYINRSDLNYHHTDWYWRRFTFYEKVDKSCNNN